MRLKLGRGRYFFILYILVLGFANVSLSSSVNDVFDELRDNSGEIREPYQAIYKIWSQIPESVRLQIERESLKAFQGDNVLSSMPRVLTESEFQHLKRGTQQRAKAIRAFLKDHYSGEKSYKDANIFEPGQLERIIVRSGEAGLEDIVRPEHIAFMYGPDIVRDKEGTWRVIEDNPGFIGGVGDLKLAAEFLLRMIPGYSKFIRPPNPDQFYKNLISRYRERSVPRNGEIVMIMTPPYADHEELRLKQIFRDAGVVVITPRSKGKIKVTEKGLYLESPGHKLKPIGFVILQGEHWWLDPGGHPKIKKRMALFEAIAHLEEKGQSEKFKKELSEFIEGIDPQTGKFSIKKLRKILRGSRYYDEYEDLLREGFRGLVRAASKGQVGVSYSPGVDFIGDKEFYMKVPQLIKYYLNEKPILKNIPTQLLGRMNPETQKVELNKEAIKAAESNPKDYVLKPVDGRGGDGVLVGAKIDSSRFLNGLESAMETPLRFISQEYKSLSLLEGSQGQDMVDIRMLAEVGPKGSIYVSGQPWGRASPTNSDGLVNLSIGGGKETLVVREAKKGKSGIPKKKKEGTSKVSQLEIETYAEEVVGRCRRRIKK